MAEWIGYDITVPLVYLDLTRATEQVSIEVSHVLGRGIQRRQRGERRKEFSACCLSDRVCPEQLALAVQTVENTAMLSILGRLEREMFCSARVPYFHVQGARTKAMLKKRLKEPLGHDFVRALKGQWEFDLAISPADGLANLLHGLSGPVFSIIAGSPSGGLNGILKERKEQKYLVIAVKSEPANIGRLLPPKISTDSKSAKDLVETLADLKLIDKLIAGTQHDSYPEHLTIATHTDSPHENPVIAAVLSRYARVCVLTGSPFGAGSSPYFRQTGIDAAVLLVKPAHVILIAAAAAASGNDFYAIPISQDRRDDIPKVEPNTPVYRTKDLIHGDDVFVVMTGISDNLILEGIQYARNGFAKTHSLCIRSGTYSQRYIEQQHNLEHKKFHHLDSSEPLSYHDVLKKYFRNMKI